MASAVRCKNCQIRWFGFILALAIAPLAQGVTACPEPVFNSGFSFSFSERAWATVFPCVLHRRSSGLCFCLCSCCWCVGVVRPSTVECSCSSVVFLDTVIRSDSVWPIWCNCVDQVHRLVMDLLRAASACIEKTPHAASTVAVVSCTPTLRFHACL